MVPDCIGGGPPSSYGAILAIQFHRCLNGWQPVNLQYRIRRFVLFQLLYDGLPTSGFANSGQRQGGKQFHIPARSEGQRCCNILLCNGAVSKLRFP
jgi:hypothetical protein